MDRKFPTHPKTLAASGAARIWVITDRIQTLVAFLIGRAVVAALIGTIVLLGPHMLAAGSVTAALTVISTTNTHKVMIYVSFGVFAMFRAIAATGNKGINRTFWEYAIFRALARVTVRRAVVGPDAVRDAVLGAAARISVITNRIQTLVTALVGHEVAALTVTIALHIPRLIGHLC